MGISLAKTAMNCPIEALPGHNVMSRCLLYASSCPAVQNRTVQWRTVQCSAVQCSAVQCSAVQCSAVQCSAVQCGAVRTPTVTSPWLFQRLVIKVTLHHTVNYTH